MAYRTRDLLVRQRTQTINALRAHLAEQGIVVPTGPAHVRRLASIIGGDDGALPAAVRDLAHLLLDQIAGLAEKIAALDAELRKRVTIDDTARQRHERRHHGRAYRLHGIRRQRQKPLSCLAPPVRELMRRKIMPRRDIHNSHPGLETLRHNPDLHRLRPAPILPRPPHHLDTTNEPVATIPHHRPLAETHNEARCYATRRKTAWSAAMQLLR